MFKQAELGRTLSVARYDAAIPKLRTGLLDAHLRLRRQSFPVIVVVSGADGGGKGELVHRLNVWLDPRGVSTHAFWDTSDEERERPRYWRFWRALPARGRIGILFGSWYTEPVIRRVMRKLKRASYAAEIDRIVAFERMLAEEGALIIKLWLHLPKAAQASRLRKLERAGRIAPDDWKHFKLYDRFAKVSGQVLRQTDTIPAPWHIIEATDRRYREYTAGRIMLNAITGRLKRAAAPARAKSRPAAPTETAPAARSAAVKKRSTVLDRVDLSQKLTATAYEKQLNKARTRLAQLAWAAYEQRRSMVLAFEGWDAAGKGSAIRRVTQGMDPRLYQVVGIAAPTVEERAQHYLWRFWRHLPRASTSTLFDRSWYGRVLVERVEGFAPPEQWGRVSLAQPGPATSGLAAAPPSGWRRQRCDSRSAAGLRSGIARPWRRP
jgi:AMP-polyphosphate phosphotransferase